MKFMTEMVVSLLPIQTSISKHVIETCCYLVFPIKYDQQVGTKITSLKCFLPSASVFGG